ncbi:hypothetical protein [Methyloceanibacter sp. wino2]|nr:hypothetical protein [Methyloceanibacter sp. wino2]
MEAARQPIGNALKPGIDVLRSVDADDLLGLLEKQAALTGGETVI